MRFLTEPTDDAWWLDFAAANATRLVANFLSLAQERGETLTNAEELFLRCFHSIRAIERNGFEAIPERHWRLQTLIEDYDAISAQANSGVLRRLRDLYPRGEEPEHSDDAWDFMQNKKVAVKELFRQFCDGAREFHLALIKLWWSDSRTHFPHVP